MPIRNSERPPRPTTLDEIRGLAVIRAFSTTEPNYAGLMGLSEDAVYREIREGRVPVTRIGASNSRRPRYRVLVAPTRRLLGDLPPLPGADAPAEKVHTR